MTYYPTFIRALEASARKLAFDLGVPYAPLVGTHGLYAQTRKKRDPMNPKRRLREKIVRVRYRDASGVLAFEEDVPIKTFPTDELIAKLVLVI